MNQIILPMKKHLAKISSCLPWFMKPSMPLLTTHPLILTKLCLSTEPTQEHLRHPISSPRPRPTFLSARRGNCGLAGSDMRVLNCTGHKINIVGIDNHELTGLDVVKAASLLDTNQGKVIGMFNEYAFLWQRKLHPFTWPNGIFQDQGR